MVGFPKKRIWALVGIPRAGKNEVSKFLVETRGFEALAFADKIKEEFGIKKEDFETAKLSGNIEELRQKLWDFSAKIKEKEPLYFINKVMQEAEKTEKSVVITDIRTKDELDSIHNIEKDKDMIRRIYFVQTGGDNFKDGMLYGSKLPMELLSTAMNSPKDIRPLPNVEKGLFYFYQYLEHFFFCEDIKDLIYYKINDTNIDRYIDQFNISQVRRV